MIRPLDPTTGETLTIEDFYTDFEHHYWNCTNFWKLERAQHFAEPGSLSWQAFNQGNWDQSLHLHETQTERLLNHHEKCSTNNIHPRRIRIIETPITPYLQWELHYLNLRDATGGPIRVLPATAITHHEQHNTIPEVCGMDDTVLYQHTYDQHGVMNATIKYTDLDTIIDWHNLTNYLYKQGQPIAPYFHRHIKYLPTPTITEQLPPDYLKQHGRPDPIKS